MRIGTVGQVLFGALVVSACTHDGAAPSSEDTRSELTDDASITAPSIAQRLVGHYALRTRVAGRAQALGVQQDSMVTRYGLVDIYELDGRLRWSERTCRMLFENQPGTSSMSVFDAVPRSTPSLESELLVSLEGDTIHWRRPEHFVASGFHDDDVTAPLPQSVTDDRLYDADGEGHSGITAHVKARVLFEIEGDVYFVERSRTRLAGTLEGERLVGEAFHESESRVLDASNLLLRIPLKAEQDLSREHSALLVPLMEEHSCDELVSELDKLFTP
jgi:hypothetical protein